MLYAVSPESGTAGAIVGSDHENVPGTDPEPPVSVLLARVCPYVIADVTGISAITELALATYTGTSAVAAV